MLIHDEVAMVNQRLHAFSSTKTHDESLTITCNKTKRVVVLSEHLAPRGSPYT